MKGPCVDKPDEPRERTSARLVDDREEDGLWLGAHEEFDLRQDVVEVGEVHRVPVVEIVGRCCHRRPSVIVVTAIVTLLAVSAAASMAKGTASLEPASGAEKAPLQDPRQALEPMAYGGAGNGGAS